MLGFVIRNAKFSSGVLLVAAFAFWNWGRNIELRRLVEHQLGINLGK